MIRARGKGQSLWGRRSPDIRPMIVWIYVLLEPRSLAVRYVGRTHDMKARSSSHASSNMGLNRWIWGLKLRGLRPRMLPVWAVEPGEDSALAERAWLTHYLLAGANLLNQKPVEGIKRPAGCRI